MGLCSQWIPFWPNLHWSPESPPTTSLPFRADLSQNVSHIWLQSLDSTSFLAFFPPAQPMFHLDWQLPKYLAFISVLFHGWSPCPEGLVPKHVIPLFVSIWPFKIQLDCQLFWEKELSRESDPFVPSISGLLPVKQNGRGYFKRLSSLLDSASASCWLNPDPLDWSSFQHLSSGGTYCRETLMLIEVTWIAWHKSKSDITWKLILLVILA